MLLDSILGLFSRDMGIDLGTANTLVLLKDKGIIINEPSVVAVQNERYGKQRIIAVGAEAKEIYRLIREVIRIVEEKQGVRLETEVKLWGRF